MASLPVEGNLEPGRDEAAKLETLQPILTFNERQRVVVMRVIDVPAAALGLHARAVLLVSRPALSILSVPEVQAIAAHELGHDYFWLEYETARRQSDALALRVLELQCDGIAILTLQGLRLDPLAWVARSPSSPRSTRRLVPLPMRITIPVSMTALASCTN